MSSDWYFAPKQSSSVVWRWGVRDLLSHSGSIFESDRPLKAYEVYFEMPVDECFVEFDTYMSTSPRLWFI